MLRIPGHPIDTAAAGISISQWLPSTDLEEGGGVDNWPARVDYFKLAISTGHSNETLTNFGIRMASKSSGTAFVSYVRCR